MTKINLLNRDKEIIIILPDSRIKGRVLMVDGDDCVVFSPEKEQIFILESVGTGKIECYHIEAGYIFTLLGKAQIKTV